MRMTRNAGEGNIRKPTPVPAIRNITENSRSLTHRAGLYSNVGRPSIAPERLLRAMLLQTFYSVRSERQWCSGSIRCQSVANFDFRSARKIGSDSISVQFRRAWQFPSQELLDVSKIFAFGSDPAGLVVDHVRDENGKMIVAPRPPSERSQCPACGLASRSVHSRYRRTISDLPAHGHAVVIEVTVRRFRCTAIACHRRIFAEQLAGEAASPFARRTVRLDKIVHCCGIALGGRPAKRLA